jgi:hypothetical protein
LEGPTLRRRDIGGEEVHAVAVEVAAGAVVMLGGARVVAARIWASRRGIPAHAAVATYTQALGPVGLAEYRRLAQLAGDVDAT